MLTYGRISASLSPEKKAEIKKKIEEIKAMIPFAINLTPEERQTLPKMSDGTVAFVSKALEYAKNNPKLVPPYLNIDELARDFELSKDMKEIFHPLSQLSEMVDDTVVAAGSDAFQVALGFYRSAKEASKAGVPGTDAVVNDLSQRFVAGAAKSSVTPAPTE